MRNFKGDGWDYLIKGLIMLVLLWALALWIIDKW
jgi:hypothetical protein